MSPAPLRLTLVCDESNIETGLWCWACMLPSRIRVPLLILGTSGVGPGGVVQVCTEREHQDAV